MAQSLQALNSMQMVDFDSAAFLRDYWQKKPLLIRNPWGNWINPLEPDDLAGLACEEGIESRLVTRKRTKWVLEHGPFPETRFDTMGKAPWTLLVQAVDHHVPDVAALIAPFRFVPNWRIDDVMVSFASDGGGVGPHFDQYDVFLVQGLGRRRVNSPGYTVTATVTQVNTASQIVVYMNGQTVVPSLWNFNPGTHVVTMNTSLNAGNNIFTITGTNAAGSNTATTNITYTIPVIVCDKPVVSFTAPAISGTIVNDPQMNVTVSVQRITSANEIRLLVNGVLQTAGTLNGSTYSKQVQLVSGQNSLEVIGTNNCGETHAATTILYRPIAAPCTPSSIQRLNPAEISAVEAATAQISASVQNIQEGSQIQLTVNGQPQQFAYDLGSHTVTATVNLAMGENTILLTAKNNCETAASSISWNIRRIECKKPEIVLLSSNVPDGGSTIGGSIGLSASITGVQSNEQITVTQNGQNIGFVYTPQTGVLKLKEQLVMGSNIFVITAKNNCGQGLLKLTFTRKEEPVKPPVITITNPSAQTTNTEEAGMTINASTTNVSQSNQVSMTINGVPASFNFNTANGTLTFNTVFQEGANVIVATAVTPGGTATDSKTVMYSKPVEQVLPPVIVLTNPMRCPATFNEGKQIFSGSVTNISSASQVTISFNGAVIPFNATVSNNILSFTFEASLTASMVNAPLVVTATNAGGTDTKSCIVTVIGTTQSEGTATEGGAAAPGSGGGRGTTGTPKPQQGGRPGTGVGTTPGTVKPMPVKPRP